MFLICKRFSIILTTLFNTIFSTNFSTTTFLWRYGFNFNFSVLTLLHYYTTFINTYLRYKGVYICIYVYTMLLLHILFNFFCISLFSANHAVIKFTFFCFCVPFYGETFKNSYIFLLSSVPSLLIQLCFHATYFQYHFYFLIYYFFCVPQTLSLSAADSLVCI